MVRERTRLGRLTLFAAPKPFTGPFDGIQRRAVASWVRLQGAEVVLIGDEEGVAQVADELGCIHVAEVERTPEGTPLVRGIFRAGQQAASTEAMCYLNADIVVTQDLVDAADTLRAWGPAYMASGRRTDLDIPAELSLEDEEALRAFARADGEVASKWYMDYFVFPRGLIDDIPEFAVGRPGWDNWLLWHATTRGAELVDLTEAVLALHQRHDYSHVGSKVTAYEGSEASRNLELMGGRKHNYNLMHARHVLTRDGEILPAPSSYAQAVRAQRWRPWRRRLRRLVNSGRGLLGRRR